MSKSVLTGQRVWLDDRQISGDVSALAVEYSAEGKDCTVVENDTRQFIGGLKVSQMQFNGYVDEANAAPDMFGSVGVSNSLLSVAAQSATVGTVAYFFKAMNGSYNISASVGDLLNFELSAASSGRLIRGVVAGLQAAATSSGTETGQQLGAIAAGQKLYAHLHVLSSSGSGDQTLDVKIESDDNSGFTSPTDRITFAQATTLTTQEAGEVAGAITDSFFRVNYTIAGTGSPTFNFVVVMGIL